MDKSNSSYGTVFTRTGDMGHHCADHRMDDGFFWPVWAAKWHLDETSFMYIYVTCPEHGSQRPVDEMKFEIHHEVHIRSYKCSID